MIDFKKLRDRVFGPPRDPFSKETRHNISLAIFLAWVGLGADGLSSSCYGPQEAFIALGEHSALAFYLAVATIITVFIISFAYMQVIELFPNGGGGYQVATKLIGPHAGLLSGSALIVDYILTIAISIASGIDAVFSLVPSIPHEFKIILSVLIVIGMVYINLRGVKESIKVLMPIFIGFVLTHGFLIVYGVLRHYPQVPHIVPNAVHETYSLTKSMGWVFVAALMMKAISLGGGTYTGLEAVSNNVGTIAEPRVRNSKLTMLIVALSLAFMAAGIITLYLIWDVRHSQGETLNAIVFGHIMEEWNFGGIQWKTIILPIVLFLETGLLFVAANTGFITGPIVLSKMATDKWMPDSFSSLSSRLVTKNGILLMGAAAIGVILATQGRVSTLVVLYSINVFVTFSLSFFGLIRHWLGRHRKKISLITWIRKFTLAVGGFCMTTCILIVTVVEKFDAGGWLTIVITSCVILIGFSIKRSYKHIAEKLNKNSLQVPSEEKREMKAQHLEHGQPTAVFILGQNIGSTVYATEWVYKTFPNVYKNFVFVGVGEVDSDAFSEDEVWEKQKKDIKQKLRYLVNHWHNIGIASTSYISYGTDVVEKVSDLTEKIKHDFPNATFFSTKLIMKDENIFTRMLFNETSYILQRKLHNMGHTIIVIPMNI